MNGHDRVRELLAQRTGVILGPDKDYFIESRLLPILRELVLPSIAALAGRLEVERTDVLARRVCEALLVNETSFYRDVLPFELLREKVFPDLIRSRAREKTLRIWSAAASTGQEIYSVATLLREHFPELATWNVLLLASDASEECVARGREGRYSQLEVNRGLPTALLVKYFERRNMEWQVVDEIRRAVEFRRINLLEPLTVPSMDLILLRNVLIYFEPPTKRSVLAQMRQTLSRDGYLLLGGAETTVYLDDELVPVPHGNAVCYVHRGDAPRTPDAVTRESSPVTPRPKEKQP